MDESAAGGVRGERALPAGRYDIKGEIIGLDATISRKGRAARLIAAARVGRRRVIAQFGCCTVPTARLLAERGPRRPRITRIT